MSDQKKQIKIPAATAIAIFISTAALAFSFGTVRWSVLLLSEQIQLRTEFEQLRQDQNQVNIQYELWLERLRQELEDAKNTEN